MAEPEAGGTPGLWRWIAAMVVQPVTTLRQAAAGAVPGPELVTMTIILVSLLWGGVLGWQQRSLPQGFWVAINVVVLNLVGMAWQVLLLWLTARWLGWRDGTMGGVFQVYAPVLAAGIVVVVPDVLLTLMGVRTGALVLEWAGALWQWVLLVLAVRAATGFAPGRALQAALPAILLWDLPWMVLALRQSA